MARIRYLKPEFFTDENLCELSFQARLTFAGLWCHADKAGRLEYRPKYLKAMIFPYDNVDIEKELKKLSEKPFILLYTIENKSFIQILTWEKHQKPHHTEKESFIPTMDMGKVIEIGTEKGMGKGMEKQLTASMELKHGLNTVKNLFDEFYLLYPRHEAKENALKYWVKLDFSNGLFDEIIDGLKKQIPGLLKKEKKYIPLPGTWLNGKRWLDEISKHEEPPLKLTPMQQAVIDSRNKRLEREAMERKELTDGNTNND